MKTIITFILINILSFSGVGAPFDYFEKNMGDKFLDKFLEEPFKYKRLNSNTKEELRINYDFYSDTINKDNNSYYRYTITISNMETYFNEKFLTDAKKLSEACIELIDKIKENDEIKSTYTDEVKKELAFKEIKGIGSRAYSFGWFAWGGGMMSLLFSTSDSKYSIWVSCSNHVNTGTVVPKIDMLKLGKAISDEYDRSISNTEPKR